MNLDLTKIQFSKNGEFAYAKDAITGAQVNMPRAYLIKRIQDQFGGSVDRFVQEFIVRDTRKYLEAGWSRQEIAELAALDKKRRLPPLDEAQEKPKKEKPVKNEEKTEKKEKAPKKYRTRKNKKRLASLVGTVETVTTENGEEVRTVTYPWSGNPSYFISPPGTLDIAAITKEACLMPNVYLDDHCVGCRYFNQCTNSLKITLPPTTFSRRKRG